MKKVIVSALAITLAAGMAIGVAAQDERADSVAPVWVTGEVKFAPTCKSPTSEIDGAVRHEWGFDCDPQTWTTSDPRLTGEAAALWNADIHEPDADVFEGDPGSNISVITRAYHVRNDAGGWACRSNHLAHGFGWYPKSETGETIMCVGEGGYEGLSAILVLVGDVDPTITGLIFAGDAPPLPEPPTVG